MLHYYIHYMLGNCLTVQKRSAGIGANGFSLEPVAVKDMSAVAGHHQTAAVAAGRFIHITVGDDGTGEHRSHKAAISGIRPGVAVDQLAVELIHQRHIGDAAIGAQILNHAAGAKDADDRRLFQVRWTG